MQEQITYIISMGAIAAVEKDQSKTMIMNRILPRTRTRRKKRRSPTSTSLMGTSNSCIMFTMMVMIAMTTTSKTMSTSSTGVVIVGAVEAETSSSSNHHQHHQNQQKQRTTMSMPMPMTENDTTTETHKFEYHMQPKLHWTTKYYSSSSSSTTTPTSRQEDQQPFTATSISTSNAVFGKGNVIRQSPFDEEILYATSTNGILLVISATNGTILQSLKPRPRILTENGKTSVWNLTSSSGISFGKSLSSGSDNDEDERQEEVDQKEEEENKQEHPRRRRNFLLVYSVTDIPPPSSRFLPKSRVVAVSIPQHTIIWTSAEVSGTTIGTPVVYSYGYHHHPQQGQQGQQPSGSAVLITHNSVVVRSSDNVTLITGHVTLLDVNSGHVRWTESDSMRFPDMSSKAYGPPTIYHQPTFGGHFIRGQNNTNDIVVWTTMTSTSVDTEEASSSSSSASASTPSSDESGYLHVFQMPMGGSIVEGRNISKHNELPDEANVETRLSTEHLLQVPWTAMSPPTIGQKGTSLFIGATKHQVHGWVGRDDDFDNKVTTNENRRWDQMPDWTARLSKLPTANPADAFFGPILTSPVLSLDNERLFVTSSSLSTSTNEAVALDVDTGGRLWSVFLGKAMMTSKAQVSPDDDRLYIALLTEDAGTEIVAIEQRTGRVVWRTNNFTQSIPLLGEVLADFEVSSKGSHIFFADEVGNILSLEVGHDGPLSDSSSTAVPGGQESTDERNANNMAQNQNADDESRLRGGAVFGIVLALIVPIVGLLYVVRLRGRRRVRRSQRNSKGSDEFAGVSLDSKQPEVGVVPVDIDRYYEDDPNGFYDDPGYDNNASDDEGSTTMVDLRETMMVDVGMLYDPEPFIQNDDEKHRSDDTTKQSGNGNQPSTPKNAEDFGYGSAIVV